VTCVCRLLNLRAPYSETHSQRRRKRGRLHDCPESSCNHRQFSDKAGLKRHLREFHGSGVYYCPYASCKRHSRGFPRKYNLLQHQKRCHGNILETLPEESTPQSSSVRLLEYSNSLMKPRDLLEERFNSSDNQLGIGSLSQWGQDLKGEDRIWKKIQELRSIRAEINQEIDRDMETLEGALGLMSDSDSLPDSFSAKGTSNRNGAPVSTRPSFAIQAPKRAFSSPDSAILSRTKSSPYNRIPPSSPMSMMETDWESDSDSGDGTYNILSNSSRAPLKGGDDQENRNGIILSPSKQASIDRIMDEFYVMFNQEWMPSFKKAPGSSDTASSQSPSQSSRASSGKSQSSRQTKRKRGVDEGSPNDDDSNDPKKPELSSTAFDTPSSGLQFACPYYKRYPERYGLHHESKNPKHKSCALKKFPSIARMK
jgi:hypothetical protein